MRRIIPVNRCGAAYAKIRLPSCIQAKKERSDAGEAVAPLASREAWICDRLGA